MRASAYDAQPEGRPSGHAPAEAEGQPAQRAAAATPGAAVYPGGIDAPRTGNTGGKLPSLNFDRRTITVHWLRVTHPASQHSQIRAYLVSRFGEPDQVRGRWFYEFGERFGNGILLLSGARITDQQGEDKDDGDEKHAVCVDVPGGALDSLDSLDRAMLCHALTLGGRVTRLDIAVDAFHSERVGLIDCIIRSCSNRELCGAKRWQPVYSYNGDELVGYGVTIGKRGNLGSGRYIRVYDKGLESGECGAGQHERFEVEFSGDCAALAAADIFADADDWEPRAWNRACGAVDFRECPSSSNRNLDRRERCAWWRKWIEEFQPLATVADRELPNLERYALWVRDTVLPTIATLAKSAQVPYTDALVHLVGHEIRPRTDTKHMRTMLADWMRHLRERPGIAAT